MNTNWHRGVLFWLIILLLTQPGGCTSDVGRPCAFLDVNMDKFTDIIAVQADRTLTVHLAAQETPTFSVSKSYKMSGLDSSLFPINCAVGDFNGDSFPDLLVSLAAKQTEWIASKIQICFGERSKIFNCSYTLESSDSLKIGGQPTVLDENIQYGLADFFVPLANGTGVCVFVSGNRTVGDPTACFNAKGLRKIRGDITHTYADFSGNLNPEFIVGCDNDSSVVGFDLVTWQYTADKGKASWKRTDLIPAISLQASESLFKSSKSSISFGHLVVNDFDADGKIDLLLPTCKDADCSGELVLSLWNGSPYWRAVHLSMTDPQSKKIYSVVKESGGQFHIRVGDYNLDGYADLLVVLQTSKGQPGLFLAYNNACKDEKICGGWKRYFEIQWDMALISEIPDGGKLQFGVFFDLEEDGILDILLQYKDKDGIDNFQFLNDNKDRGDTSFLKVEVYTSTCGSDCKNGHEGSNVAAPGATLRYESVDSDGKPIQGRHTQLCQSSHSALQLPYVVFGLGRTPNFVDHLEVGVPSKAPYHKSWPQIVPNSRLFIVPYPLASPHQWISRLYVTPSRLIVLSLIALCAICALLLVLIAALHWRERRQDAAEKKQDAHKFHFDAM